MWRISHMQSVFILLFILIFCSASIQAQTASNIPVISPPALELDFDPRVYGADIDINLGFPGQYTNRWTQLHARIGAGLQKEGYHRRPDGSLFISSQPEELQQAMHRRIEFGARYGLLHGIGWNEETQQPRAQGFLLLTSSYDRHLVSNDPDYLISATDYPDRLHSLTQFIIAGIFIDSVQHSARVRDGEYLETALEFGPYWLGNRLLGNADFLRLHARGIFYRPLFTEGLYWVNGSYLDILWGGWAKGSTIPTNQRASFGGFAPRSGLGGTVRGFYSGRFDADVKFANAMDIRYQFPPVSVVGIGLLGYWDIGYYRELRDSPADDPFNLGWLASNGAGISITLLESWTLVLYSHLPWFGATAYEEDAGGLSFTLDFGFHQ